MTIEPAFGNPESFEERFHRVLQRVAQDDMSAAQQTGQLQTMKDDLLDYRPGDQIAFYSTDWWYEKFPEDELARNAVKFYSGKGGSHDNHHARNLFYRTFEHHPNLMAAYTRGAIH